jgi:hypothetical protein
VPQKLLTGARTEGLRAVRLEARTSRAGRRQYRRSPYIEVWRSVPATVIPRELRHSFVTSSDSGGDLVQFCGREFDVDSVGVLLAPRPVRQRAA